MRRVVTILAFCVSGCASSFCGAPCETGADRAAARPENHFGTPFGHLDVWSMDLAELRSERSELESLLGKNEKDAAILKVLNDRKGGPDGWIYDGFTAGGSKFRPNGKLRREVGVEDVAKRTMIGIHESPQKERFERYRQVRMQLLSIPGGAETAKATVDTATPAPVDSVSQAERDTAAAIASTEPASQDSSIAAGTGAVVATSPEVVAVASAGDSSWIGSFRANSVAPATGSGTFAGLEECRTWAERKADDFRAGAFAFEFECKREGRVLKRKVW